MKKKDIAESIGVTPSTITRELRRNSGRHGHYNWETAQKNASYHRHRRPGNRASARKYGMKCSASLPGSNGRRNRSPVICAHVNYGNNS